MVTTVQFFVRGYGQVCLLFSQTVGGRQRGNIVPWLSGVWREGRAGAIRQTR